MKKILKKWKCPICGAIGKRWQSSWRANRSGRQHINNNHKKTDKLLILKRTKTEIKEG